MTQKHDETNVFKIPHGRMMQLVNTCNNKLVVTDFANSDALFGLLTNLQGVFKEFKSHEEIENEFIMKKLKSKLTALAIHNTAVCNCHKEDEFTPLFDLVDTGYLHINKTKTTSEKISFGVKLRKALNQFTRRFVPHMKEEEEVFQPLLMKYFSEEELVEMKIIVIKCHMQRRKTDSFGGVNDAAGAGSEHRSGIDDLPSELMLKIFSYLNNSEKLKAAQVSHRWNELVYSKVNWRSLNFMEWIGPNKYVNSTDYDSDMEPRRSFGFKDIEYIDDSDEEYEDESQIQEQEVKLLQFWIKNFLPKVGASVRDLNISQCKSLNNNLARRILQLCPNLKVLNLSYTNIGDNSFRGVKLARLEQLDCEGCENLSDKAFKYLLDKRGVKGCETSSCHSEKDQATKEGSNCESCIGSRSSIEELTKKRQTQQSQKSQQPSTTSLKYINLSGCWSITDNGLEYIAKKYDLTNLQYLNLSGCLNISSMGMNLFVEIADELDGENLYYCDNIDDGPLKDTANGCANLESPDKFCCRRCT